MPAPPVIVSLPGPVVSSFGRGAADQRRRRSAPRRAAPRIDTSSMSDAVVVVLAREAVVGDAVERDARGGRGGEHRVRGAVDPGAAAERVGAGAAVERVVARAAAERVVAGAAVEHVVAVAAVERVRAGPAVELVVAGAAGEHHRAAEQCARRRQSSPSPRSATIRSIARAREVLRRPAAQPVAWIGSPSPARATRTLPGLAGVGHAERHRARPAGGGGVGQRGPGLHEGGRVGAAAAARANTAHRTTARIATTIWLIPPARRSSAGERDLPARGRLEHGPCA